MRSLATELIGSVPRRVMLLIIILSINGLFLNYLIIVLSAYLPELGVSTETVGLILGAEGLSMAGFAIPLGVLSDRRGRKWILIVGTIGATPMFFVVASTLNPALLVIVGVLGGILEGAFLATVNAMIADQTTPENRDSAFTLSFILGGMGTSLGTAIPFFIPSLQGILGLDKHAVHVHLLILFGLFSLLIPMALYFLLRDYQETLRPVKGLWKGKSTKNLLKFSGINSLIGLGAGFIIPLIPAWLYLKFAIPDTYSGPVLTISSFTIGLAAVFSPRLAKRLGLVKAISLTQALSLFFMVSLAFVGDPVTAAFLYVIRTMLMNMANPLADSFLMGIVVPEDRGFASSVNSVIWRIPNSVTTIIGGAILASGNFELPFLIAGAFYAVAIFLYYTTFKNTKAIS
jgi:MFS family permease